METLIKPPCRDRRTRLREALGKGWLLLYKGGEYFNENLYYLTGLDTFYTFALISLETHHEYIITNPFECLSAKSLCDVEYICECRPNKLVSKLTELFRKHKISLLYCDYAFDSRTPLPPELVDLLRGTFSDLTLQPLPSQLFRMRMLKEPFEISTIKKGIKIIKELFAELPAMIKPGVSEADIAAEIYKHLIRSGFNKFYDVFVASGPNSAIPFYRANKGYLPDNSVVLIDICAAIDYYVCDLTRLFSTSGSFTERQEKLYSIIRNTYAKAIQDVRPGTSLAELSEKAKKTLAGYGLDKYYPNKIGHFVGLSPDDPGDQDTVLEQGMVLTIEPGLYLPNEGLGIRIEDTVIVV
ncbi:MAG: Xaa-Pro peptidase family protein [Deltaproteobacteria bacterium]|nr:Xaa-Pro peptidase family protein [Deltaproteobacteria bacterium]